MRYDIYIAIEGKGFDDAAFDRDLPPALRGEVVERRHMRISTSTWCGT